MNQVARFDIAAHLDSDEAIALYLSLVLESGDMEELLAAINHIARAKGISQIAANTGFGRESLYKSLKPGSKPRFETILKVLQALGIQLTAAPAAHSN